MKPGLVKGPWGKDEDEVYMPRYRTRSKTRKAELFESALKDSKPKNVTFDDKVAIKYFD